MFAYSAAFQNARPLLQWTINWAESNRHPHSVNQNGQSAKEDTAYFYFIIIINHFLGGEVCFIIASRSLPSFVVKVDTYIWGGWGQKCDIHQAGSNSRHRPKTKKQFSLIWLVEPLSLSHRDEVLTLENDLALGRDLNKLELRWEVLHGGRAERKDKLASVGRQNERWASAPNPGPESLVLVFARRHPARRRRSTIQITGKSSPVCIEHSTGTRGSSDNDNDDDEDAGEDYDDDDDNDCDDDSW